MIDTQKSVKMAAEILFAHNHDKSLDDAIDILQCFRGKTHVTVWNDYATICGESGMKVPFISMAWKP